MKNILIIYLVLISLLSCNPEAGKNKSGEIHRREQKDFEKIDFHSHYRYDRKCLEPLFDNWNLKAVLVNVGRMDQAQNEERWELLKEQYRKYPDRYFLCTSFAALNIDQPDFAEKIIEKLTRDFQSGAVMVKVWKVNGMEIQDGDGNYIQIDDPRIQPVWDFIAEKDFPVLAHIGEPRAAWLPLDEKSPHYNYYKNNPQYHAYQHPEIPSWETIIEARDRWIEKNPDLRIIAAHMGSMAHDITMVAERLDKYPNMYVETAARFGDLTLQDSKNVREFFIKYQDRILYGTDLGFSSSATGDDPEDCDFAGSVISRHWMYFTEKDSINFSSPMVPFPIKTKGLDLPDSVLRKIYFENAKKILSLN